MSSIQNEILDSIAIMIEKSVKNYVPRQDFQSVVMEVKGDKYRVTIQGSDYWLKCGFDSTLGVGDPVWVHVPNGTGNFSSAFIMARR